MTKTLKERISELKIHELVCTKCGKPINKGTRVGCACVFISQNMGGIDVECPEHILEDERERTLKDVVEFLKKHNNGEGWICINKYDLQKLKALKE